MLRNRTNLPWELAHLGQGFCVLVLLLIASQRHAQPTLFVGGLPDGVLAVDAQPPPDSGRTPPFSDDTASWTIPFEITPEIRRWAQRRAPLRLPPAERIRRLAEALATESGTALVEVSGPTSTADEVFHSRRANCVGYANLLIAAAREVDVPAFFVLVGDLGAGRRQGSLEIDEGHLAVAFGDGDGLRIFDFAGISKASDLQWRPITDLTAIALYYSNRGVEDLLARRFSTAMDWLSHAVQLDPELTAAWINYGVAARHAGNLETARQAYEQALRLDPAAAAAYRNLAHLLRQRGRPNEAADVLEDAAQLPRQGPLDFLAEGNSHLLAGDLLLARGYYQRALSQSMAADRPPQKPRSCPKTVWAIFF